MIPRRAAAAGFGLFALNGAAQGMYGTAIPGMARSFGLGAADAGLVVSAHFAGGLTGVLAAAAVERRLSTRGAIAAGASLLAAGSLGIAAAPAWAALLVAAFVLGLGAGNVGLGFNRLFATGFGGRSAGMLNLLNACFGTGAIVGPVAVALAAGGGFRLPFAAAGLLALLLVPFVLALPAEAAPLAGARGARAGRRSRWPLAAFVALFALYVGAEVSAGGWGPTHLASAGLTARAAGTTISLYWAALAAGRLLAVPVAFRFAPERIVVAAIGAATAAFGLAQVPAAAPAAYAAAGFALAPIFPTGLAWLVRALPEGRAAAHLVVAGGMVGGIVVPALVGRLVAAVGAVAIPGALAGAAAACLLVALALARATRRPAVAGALLVGSGSV